VPPLDLSAHSPAAARGIPLTPNARVKPSSRNLRSPCVAFVTPQPRRRGASIAMTSWSVFLGSPTRSPLAVLLFLFVDVRLQIRESLASCPGEIDASVPRNPMLTSSVIQSPARMRTTTGNPPAGRGRQRRAKLTAKGKKAPRRRCSLPPAVSKTSVPVRAEVKPRRRISTLESLNAYAGVLSSSDQGLHPLGHDFGMQTLRQVHARWARSRQWLRSWWMIAAWHSTTGRADLTP